MLITIGSASLLSLQLSNLSQLCQSQAQPVAKKTTSVLHYNDYLSMSAQQYVHSDSMKYLHSTFRRATLDYWMFPAGKQLQPFLGPFRNGEQRACVWVGVPYEIREQIALSQ